MADWAAVVSCSSGTLLEPKAVGSAGEVPMSQKNGVQTPKKFKKYFVI